MKSFLVLGVMAAVSMTTCLPEDYTRFDSIDIDEIISNDRLLNSYVQCFLDKGKCTREAQDIKKSIPEVMTNTCASCTEAEKVKIAKVTKTVRDKDQADYKLFVDKYVTDLSTFDNFLKQYAP